MRRYYIDVKTGETMNTTPPDEVLYLVTYGKRYAKAVSRAVKKGNKEKALHYANKGIGFHCDTLKRKAQTVHT